jgi:hypothetical protein
MNILKNVKQLLKRRSALQAEMQRIDAILAPLGDLNAEVKRGPGRPPKAGGRQSAASGRKPMSAEARARISAAATARWKKAKAAGRSRL